MKTKDFKIVLEKPEDEETKMQLSENDLVQDAKKVFTVLWAYMDEDGEPYTGTSIVNAEDEAAAKKIVKSYHPKATSMNVKPGRLGYDYEELWHEKREIDDADDELLELLNEYDALRTQLSSYRADAKNESLSDDERKIAADKAEAIKREIELPKYNKVKEVAAEIDRLYNEAEYPSEITNDEDQGSHMQKDAMAYTHYEFDLGLRIEVDKESFYKLSNDYDSNGDDHAAFDYVNSFNVTVSELKSEVGLKYHTNLSSKRENREIRSDYDTVVIMSASRVLLSFNDAEFPEAAKEKIRRLYDDAVDKLNNLNVEYEIRYIRDFKTRYVPEEEDKPLEDSEPEDLAEQAMDYLAEDPKNVVEFDGGRIWIENDDDRWVAHEDDGTPAEEIIQLKTREDLKRALTKYINLETEGHDDFEYCTWCNELFPQSDMVHEKNLGWLCNRCAAAIRSRGEKLTVEDDDLTEDGAKHIERNLKASDYKALGWKELVKEYRLSDVLDEGDFKKIKTEFAELNPSSEIRKKNIAIAFDPKTNLPTDAEVKLTCYYGFDKGEPAVQAFKLDFIGKSAESYLNRLTETTKQDRSSVNKSSTINQHNLNLFVSVLRNVLFEKVYDSILEEVKQLLEKENSSDKSASEQKKISNEEAVENFVKRYSTGDPAIENLLRQWYKNQSEMDPKDRTKISELINETNERKKNEAVEITQKYKKYLIVSLVKIGALSKSGIPQVSNYKNLPGYEGFEKAIMSIVTTGNTGEYQKDFNTFAEAVEAKLQEKNQNSNDLLADL